MTALLGPAERIQFTKLALYCPISRFSAAQVEFAQRLAETRIGLLIWALESNWLLHTNHFSQALMSAAGTKYLLGMQYLGQQRILVQADQLALNPQLADLQGRKVTKSSELAAALANNRVDFICCSSQASEKPVVAKPSFVLVCSLTEAQRATSQGWVKLLINDPALPVLTQSELVARIEKYHALTRN